MQHLINEFLESTGRGIITAAEARNLGCSPDVVRTMVRSGDLVRIGRGVYASAPAWHPRTGDKRAPYVLRQRRHLLRLDGLLRRYGPKVAASHQTAVLAWGLPTESRSLERVHLVHTRRGRTARRRPDFSIHTCELAEVITRHQGRRLVVPALAVIGQAMHVGLAPGVAAMDAAIANQLTTRQELETMLTRMRHTPRLGAARRAVRMVDGLAESPGETRLRLILIELGVRFMAQHWIRVAGGVAHYRVDFYLPDLGVVLEYDGQIKYGAARSSRERADRSDPATGQARRTVAQEKAREDDLRLEGFGVGRVTADTLNRQHVAAIIDKARQQAQPQAIRRAAEPPPWARPASA